MRSRGIMASRWGEGGAMLLINIQGIGASRLPWRDHGDKKDERATKVETDDDLPAQAQAPGLVILGFLFPETRAIWQTSQIR